MRIFATLLSVALLSIPGASLFAQDMMAGTGFYVAAGGGITLITDISEVPEKGIIAGEDEADWDLDFGFGAGGSAGYDFGDFRTEAEFSFQSANFLRADEIDDDTKADDNLTVMSILANGFFDLDTGTPFVPFIGIGAGAVNLAVKLNKSEDADEAHFEGSGWGFAYQANVGVAYEIIDAVALTLGYKFFGTLETQVTHPDDEETYVKPTLMAHRAELGVRFSF
ncbi:MAG: outer membrane beta-barrel protein [Spirochaetaceae bacterium]|nr:outer membrane beta-barrel protein [Spirochaetaceae bacterium]